MTTGKAYGLFDCRASGKEIEAELPYIKDYTQTTSDLCLMKVGELEGDPDAMQIAEEFSTGYGMEAKFPMKYVMRSTLPYADNTATGDQVVDILNQAYQSPLWDEKESFIGEITYEEGGVRVCRL